MCMGNRDVPPLVSVSGFGLSAVCGSVCLELCVVYLDYVDNNPQAFKDAYFAFNALRIYKHRSHHHG